MLPVPNIRLRDVNQATIQTDGRYVLYWMVAARRTEWNFGLQHAVELANQLELPILILEALRCDYEWSSARMHRFFVQGMADNHEAARQAGIRYYCYLEPDVGSGCGLIPALAQSAAAVVTDDYPCIFVPRMLKAAGKKLNCRLTAVDSNGIVPLRAPDKTFSRAYDFRRYFQKNARDFLASNPEPDPLEALENRTRVQVPGEISQQWPEVDPRSISEDFLGRIPFQEDVSPVDLPGGSAAASAALDRFIENRLTRYNEGRRDLDRPSTSQMSPYFRFGHISSHQVVARVLEQEQWSPGDVSEKVTGSASGFLGVSENAESFLDELISWREVGYNMSARNVDYDQFESLPDWAQKTLEEHSSDHRPEIYNLEQFEKAETHDELWNAAQNQLRVEGIIHNYMRMVWGKKILHWSKSPQEALKIMIHLNNKYAIDGRDPNSYSGIFWVLGRYDRAWGPEREVFGKIRYMSQASTRTKLKVKNYIARFAKIEEGSVNS